MSEWRPVLLIDLSHLYWSAWFGSPGNAQQATLDAVATYARDAGAVALCCDPGGENWRHRIYPDYKANRPEKDPHAIAEFERTKERLAADGYLLWQCEHFEADDVIATAVAFASGAHEPPIRVTIATADKDLFQLLSPTVQIVDTRNGQLIDEATVLEKTGVHPGQVRDWLALMGDTSDHVPGVKSVGEKTAARLLKDFSTIKAILAAAKEEDRRITPSICAKLNEETTRMQLTISWKLVGLRTDAPIRFEEIFEDRSVKVLTRGEAEGLRRAAAVIESDLARDEVDVWTPALEDDGERPGESGVMIHTGTGVVTLRTPSPVVTGVEHIIGTLRDAKLLRTYIGKQLHRGAKDGEGDFGKVPGTSGKNTLFLSGAQKIAAYYNVRPVYEIAMCNQLPGGHVEFVINCRLISRATGEEVSSGLGSCSTMETKYRFRSAEAELTDRKVPKEYWDVYKEDPKRGSAILGGKEFTTKKTELGWFIAKKTGERAENENIHDVRNTVLKMAKKRGYVDAVIALGCMSELFTQDIGDTYDLTEVAEAM